VRAQEVGGFPSRTITEDYALGMELNKAGYGLRYLPAYLATGAAPNVTLRLLALPTLHASSSARVTGSARA
jgi:cellulose synthase/poly-beta-1,6-N-acetylglucosamine synthase-like glycosyltransferase